MYIIEKTKSVCILIYIVFIISHNFLHSNKKTFLVFGILTKIIPNSSLSHSHSVKGLKVVGQLEWESGGWDYSVLPFCPEVPGVGGQRWKGSVMSQACCGWGAPLCCSSHLSVFFTGSGPLLPCQGPCFC